MEVANQSTPEIYDDIYVGGGHVAPVDEGLEDDGGDMGYLLITSLQLTILYEKNLINSVRN